MVSNPNASPSGVLPSEGRGRGLRQGAYIRQGLTITRADVVYDQASEARFECPGEFLRFHFKLAGASAISDDRSDYVPVEAGQISIVAQPADAYKRERVLVDTHERSVTLVCERDFAADIFSGAENVPGSVSDFMRKRLSGMMVDTLPMPVRLRSIVEDILQPPLAGRLGDMMIEAKALELLCFTVHQLATSTPSDIRIKNRDRQRVREICAMLQSDPAAPLDIHAMCRNLAWNETQMMRTFRAIMGSPISTYRHQLLMAEAKRRLEETDHPVTQIAFDAGYEHPSNFATAFKRAFGYPPSTMRGTIYN